MIQVIPHVYTCIYIRGLVTPGAYEPPEGASNCVERQNCRDTSLIWTYSQVGRKCCFHSQSAMLGAPSLVPLFNRMRERKRRVWENARPSHGPRLECEKMC